MQGELGKILGYHCHHTSIMRTRRHFTEIHQIALHEKLDAKEAKTTETSCNRSRNLFCVLQRGIAHGLWLPRFTIVTIDLNMPNWIAKARPIDMPHRQKRNLIVKVHKAFYDYFPLSRTAPFLGIIPGSFPVGIRLDHTLSLS